MRTRDLKRACAREETKRALTYPEIVLLMRVVEGPWPGMTRCNPSVTGRSREARALERLGLIERFGKSPELFSTEKGMLLADGITAALTSK